MSGQKVLTGRPLFWGALAGGLVCLFQAGVKGSLIALFSGLAVYGGCWLFMSPSGRKMIRSMLQK
jgi:hypothetical protein